MCGLYNSLVFQAKNYSLSLVSIMSKSRLENGYKERVKKISERLQTMQIVLDPERNLGFSDIEKKLEQLEGDFSEACEQNNKKFNILKDQIQKIELNVDKELKNRSQFFQSRSDELNRWQEKIHAGLNKYLKGKKEGESKIFSVIEERFEGLKSKVREECRNFEDTEAEATKFINQDLPKIAEIVQEGVDLRKFAELELNKRLETGLAGLKNDLAVEKKMREETEEAMLAMLRDVVSRIKNDLDTERKERENSEENILGLLEETCEKISSITIQ